MKKLYAGLAAAALTATGIACTAGAAQATGTPWSLGYAPSSTVSTAINDTTLYTAAVNDEDNTVDVSATVLATGSSTHRTVSLTPADGMSIDYIDSAAVTSTGEVVISAGQSGDDYDSGVWTAQAGETAATETISGLDGTGTVAVSPDGEHAALAVGRNLYSFAPSDTSATSVALDEDEDADVNVTALTVADDAGGIFAVGTDSATGEDDGVPYGWSVQDGDVDRSPELADEPVSVTLAGSTLIIGERNTDDWTYSLQVFGQDEGVTSVALPDEPDLLAVSPDGNTVFASDGYDIERVDLTRLGSYTDASQVPETYFDDEIGGLVATSDAFYFVSTSDDGDASLSRLTKPGAVTNVTQTVYSDGSVNLEWTAPADTGGSDATYVVTLKDKASGKVITDEVTDTYDYLDSRKGLQSGHTYDITVRAENAAFAGKDVAAAPVLPGASTVTVSGSAVVGGTLTANFVDKWPAGTKVSYQWGYSGGQYGGPVDGATGRTFSPTADLAGLQVTVTVTGSLAGYSPTTVTSAPVVVKAASHTAPATPQPEKVTKIKAKPIKASAKKVKLSLPGIDVKKAPGKVKVYDGKKLIGKAKIKNGKLVLKLKKHLSHGKHKLKLTYKGSAKVAKFKEKVKLKVK